MKSHNVVELPQEPNLTLVRCDSAPRFCHTKLHIPPTTYAPQNDFHAVLLPEPVNAVKDCLIGVLIPSLITFTVVLARSEHTECGFHTYCPLVVVLAWTNWHERFVPWLMEAGLDDEYEMTFRHTVRQYMTSQTVRTVVCFATLLAIFVPQC